MSTREIRRLEVLIRLDGGLLIAQEAATLLGLSIRHTRRILAAYRKGGAATLAHGNRGRLPRHTVKPDVRKQIVELTVSKYPDYNHQHLSEVLSAQEGLSLSRSTVRRTLLASGIKSPRKRRAPKHRQRRERYAQEGMLIQIDGSPHDWLEGRGPWLNLIAGVDDATGKIAGAVFRAQEDAQGYFLLLEQITAQHGIPLAVYHDRHGIFERLPHERETLHEQLAGHQEPTQFGRLLQELGIGSVRAHSPQAKGRVERLFGTLQDRLVKALREANAMTLEEANTVLKSFVGAYNAQFGVEPAQGGVAYRSWPEGKRREEVFCFKYERVVGADNTVRFARERLPVLASQERASYARVRVEGHERMDGSLGVYHEGRCLVTREAPVEAPVLRARKGKRVGQKGASEALTDARTDAPVDAGAQSPRAVEMGESVAAAGASSPIQGATTEGSIPTPTSTPKGTAVPGPNHPWRTISPKLREQLKKQATVTQSLNS